ncbi:MAG: hypothetical protein ABSH19_02575 [Opitutales bacterium]|jgi:hypothetical protein
MSAAKRTEDKSTLGGALAAGVINVILGVVIGFCVLAATAPQAYSPTPKKEGDPPPPLPAGIWYWKGDDSGGDWQSKEPDFLAGAGPLTLADTDLNGWAQAGFKATPPAAAAAAAPGAAPPAAPNFNAVAGVPNFRSWQAKAGGAGYFQVAMPFAVTVLGFNVEVLYQARGTFKAGPQGPEFEPTYSSFGSARLPTAGGVAGMVFNELAKEFIPDAVAKKYAGAWGKFNSATPQDGQLVLARQ